MRRSRAAAPGKVAPTPEPAPLPPPPPATPVKPETVTKLLGLTGLEVNPRKKAPVDVFVFFDANCPFSALLWKKLQALPARPHMRWLPVALLTPSSATRAQYLMTHGVNALDDNFQHHDAKTHSGHAPEATLTPALKVRLERNRKLLALLSPGTPT